MRAVTIFGLLAAGCGGSAPEPVAQHRALADAPAAGSDDVVVARVDGHPVWASCVTAQATRTAGDRKAALRDCIDFELLAWRAAAAGLADDPAVLDAMQTAMVGRVIDDYEDHTQPSDLEPTFSKLVPRATALLRHPEYRGSSYVRIPLAKDAPADAVAHAHDVAAHIAAALTGERGLSDPDLVAIAQPIADAAHVELDHEAVQPTLAIGLEEHYGAALYAIAEVGRTAGPIRTSYGWDVILYATGIDAESASDAVLRDRVLTDARRLHFPLWVDAIAHRLGVQPVLDPAADKTLEDAP